MAHINKGGATRLVQQGSSKMELTNSYWDCECKVNYIHPKNQSRCIHCDTNAVDQPDSRLSELQGPVEKNIPPFPHAPNWCYMCPHCFKNWEMAERCADFRIPCSECVRILIGGSKQ